MELYVSCILIKGEENITDLQIQNHRLFKWESPVRDTVICICVKFPRCVCFSLSSPFQFSSIAQSCPTFCNPVDCATPSFPVHHQLLELAQTHVHKVSDAIQPSHSLSSPLVHPVIAFRNYWCGIVMEISWI